MIPVSRPHAAFTLLELLLVLALVGVLIGIAMPRSEPSLHEQLRGAARIVAHELAYARSLAVSNNSSYRVTFDVPGNRFVLEHSGANTALDKLPLSAFHQPDDPPTQHIVSLGQLPSMGMPVRLVGAVGGANGLQYVTSLEFGPLGETTQAAPTTIWLAVARGAAQCYITVTVDPITGLTDVGQLTAQPPPSVIPVETT